MPMLLFDAVWIVQNILIFVWEVKAILRLVRANPKQRCYKTLWNEYISFWNLVDWASLVNALFLILFFMLLLSSGRTWEAPAAPAFAIPRRPGSRS